MKKISLLALLATLGLSSYAAEINIVAAENFYGELAKEIGGNQVRVQSIISNPDADPHLFTTSPSISKAIRQAQIIIYNGADYDSWINQMIAGVDKKKVTIINVADLVGVKSGQNPHLWYKPDTFPKLAKILADKISAITPSGAAEVNQNLITFINDHNTVVKMINTTKSKYAGTPVTATEPVYGYMADAMGLKMEGIDFQWKVMNDTEPTPKIIADYQSLLTKKQVKALFYNSQVSDSITKNMQDLAKKYNIPVVGVTETMPANTTINKWLTTEVQNTNHALAKK
ncbi:MAG: zinc/manganese transport system substrate-binding protein [Pseudomonadota bacterium]|nr:zinc/manganese transport system substrate-binding protein [Pseudomonadota bacterium]